MRSVTNKMDSISCRKSVKTGSQPHLRLTQPILHLQQQVGNLALQRLLQTRLIQARLTIGQPDDKYEQEADRVADQVMRMPNPVGRSQAR